MKCLNNRKKFLFILTILLSCVFVFYVGLYIYIIYSNRMSCGNSYYDYESYTEKGIEAFNSDNFVLFEVLGAPDCEFTCNGVTVNQDDFNDDGSCDIPYFVYYGIHQRGTTATLYQYIYYGPDTEFVLKSVDAVVNYCDGERGERISDGVFGDNTVIMIESGLASILYD